MTKKKAIAIISVGIALIGAGIVTRFGTKPFPDIREYAEDAAEKKQAENAALGYVQEKYGEKAVYQDHDSITGITVVKVSAGSDVFRVWIDENGTAYADDRDSGKINEALRAEFMQTYPDCTIEYLQTGTQSQYIGWRAVLLDSNTHFDGTNLDSILQEQDNTILLSIYSAGTEFADSPLLEKLSQWNTEGALVTFDTAAHLDEFMQTGGSEQGFPITDLRDGYCKRDVLYAPHIQSIRLLYNGISDFSYPLRQGDGFLYCCPQSPENGCTEIDPKYLADSFSNLEKWNEAEYEKVVNDSSAKACRFDNMWSDAYIYLPLADHPENADVRLLCSIRNTVDLVTPNRYGDYAVFRLPASSDPEWMLVHGS